MNENNTENIKIGLLGLIALTLVVNVFIGDDNESQTVTAGINNPSPVSNITANPASPAPGINPVPPNQISTAINNTQPQQPTGPTTTMSFAETKFDYGTIKQHSTDNKHIFKFTNTGDKPLVINSATGSCGCTVPEWPKEPIAPGKTGEIIVDFKPGTQQGLQNKTVTVLANTNPPSSTLQISAVVEVAESPNTPAQ